VSGTELWSGTPDGGPPRWARREVLRGRPATTSRRIGVRKGVKTPTEDRRTYEEQTMTWSATDETPFTKKARNRRRNRVARASRKAHP